MESTHYFNYKYYMFLINNLKFLQKKILSIFSFILENQIKYSNKYLLLYINNIITIKNNRIRIRRIFFENEIFFEKSDYQ